MLITLSRNWWATVARGVAAIGLGIFAWLRPDVFWPALVVIFGVYAIVDGLFAIVAAVKGETGDRWLHLLEGFVGVGVGGFVFVNPEQAGTAIVLVVGLWAIVTGVLEIISAIRLRQEIADEWLLGIGGALSIILGALLIARPQFGQVTTTYILGTYGIIFGAVLVMLGLRLRGLA
ncbi:MAG: DUF308 domain-containing protein [Chloroflexota bacterium]|nr:DUF308 domain-containing protein [Chloroflexia bacterium]MDQ3227608.1 DUF308 domain-containing protein [Chloroflexota bacterium]